MKLVFSRKGFDSAAGGIASPIFPDGRMVSLPIPSQWDSFTFADIKVPGIDMNCLLADLSRQRFSINDHIHLDPDIDRPIDKRLPGWRPALGQVGAAQTHLENQGVGPGDVFLFFGWFRNVELKEDKWRYVPDAPDLHVLFGWLEVDVVVPLGLDQSESITAMPWIADHPHAANPGAYGVRNNTLYVSPPHSRIKPGRLHGGGRFAYFADTLRLTASSKGRSEWSLPRWFQPGKRPSLSYHGSEKRWQPTDDRTILNTVGRGQEFVIDGDHYPELEDWVCTIIRNHA